ncbi:tRNA (adenosine(37)-N6)-threonylcarbamoyltransferase complex dimerization subunit type 1 TsaB [bacterium]|nr:MAG: tRNA (adenosine(37)-N6)-threonylcarbamoyltransferase complex dimerization subunit type 1 TsaB [bacterium]
MILLLDTSTSLCKLSIIDTTSTFESEWQADRQLSRGLLTFIQTELAKQSLQLRDCEGIGVFKGPGSFTGLRIGLTVANTLADGLNISIVGESGDGWQITALDRLRSGENDAIVLPDYGGDAHITKPRK